MNGKAFFEWSDNMSVDIAEIDTQHKMLIDILNRLFMSVMNREQNTVTTEVLDALIDYTKTHFELEERLMLDAGYDPMAYAAHCTTHQEFIDKVGNAARKFLVEEKTVSFELINFLKHWLRDHILVTDQKYAAALRDQGYVTHAWETSANSLMTQKQNASEHSRKHWWNLW